MELPPYHVPVLRGVLLHTWERTWLYIKKAGTVILAVNIVLWAFMYFPRPPERSDGKAPTAAEALAHSMAGRFGHALEPVSKLAGFDWRTNIALLGGFAAKEVVVGALGTVYAMDIEKGGDSAPLAARLAAEPDWSPRRAFAMMLFVMLYAPCMTTIAVIARESGSWKWAAFSTLYATTIAFVIALAVYQAGRLVG
jgi:ferrous iron transport protein B